MLSLKCIIVHYRAQSCRNGKTLCWFVVTLHRQIEEADGGLEGKELRDLNLEIARINGSNCNP